MPQIQSGSFKPVYSHEKTVEEKDLETTSLPNLGDQIQLQHLDINSIQQGTVDVQIPLKEGVHLIPGRYENIELHVKKNAIMLMSFKIARNSDNEPIIEKVSIVITPSVKMTNPSSALEEKGWANGIKDLFADAYLSGAEIGQDGKIHLQGRMKKLIIYEDINKSFKPELLPQVDLRLHVLFGKRKTIDENSIRKMLGQLSKLMGESSCGIRMTIRQPELHVASGEVSAKTDTEDLKLSFHFLSSLQGSRSIQIKTDPDHRSHLQAFHTDCQVEALLELKDFPKVKVDGELSVDALVDSTAVSIEASNGLKIPMVLGKRGNFFRSKISVDRNKPSVKQLEYDLDATLAESGPITKGFWSLQFEKAHFHVDGYQNRAQASLRVSHPSISGRKISKKVLGEFNLDLTTEDFDHGNVAYRINPEIVRFFERQLHYQIYPEGHLALTPETAGLSAVLDPEHKFVWRPDQIADPASAPTAELGSNQWREMAEEITQSKILSYQELTLLIDGKESFPKRLELIKNAKHSILLQSFIFRDDDSGKALAQALIEAHRRGVKVYVVTDSFGNIRSVSDLINANQVHEMFQKEGIQFEAYGNTMMRGLSKIFSVLRRTSSERTFQDIQAIFDPHRNLSFLSFLAKAVLGKIQMKLNAPEIEEMHQGLKMILGNDQRASLAIERLSNLHENDSIESSELIELVTQMLHLNHRWHEKYMIVDGQVALMGGMNIADEYMKGGLPERVMLAGVSRPAWRDTDILVRGNQVAGLVARAFVDNWETCTGERLTLEVLSPRPTSRGPDWISGQARDDSSIAINLSPEEPGSGIQMIHSRPWHLPYHPITNLKIEAIKSLKAGDKLYEASAYFLPVGALKPYQEALKLAAQRGVDVRIVTNSEQSTDAPQVNRVARISCYRDLLKAGVRIFERTGDRTMHQKVAAYGGRISMVGSYNLDNRSGSFSNEDAGVIYSEQFTHQIEDMLLTDMASDVAREVSLKDVESSPAAQEIESSLWAMLEDLM